MTATDPDSNDYWGYECANCRSPIAIKPDDGRPIMAPGKTFTLHCVECGFDGEYPHDNIHVLSLSEEEGSKA